MPLHHITSRMPTITGLTDVDLNFDHLAECSGFFTVKLLFPSSLHTVPFGWSHYAQPTPEKDLGFTFLGAEYL